MTVQKISTALLLVVFALGLVVGCGALSPSDQREPVATVTQADTLDLIVPATTPAAGYLPSRSSVSASGGYELVIPIDVAEGRAGMKPHLAFRHASGAGMDALGVGWSVAGAMSIIRPCAPTFATNGHVDFPTQLCLDQQQLVEIGDTGEYRTENESFAQILAQPANASWPESWVVRLKNGRIRKYAPVRYDGAHTRFWALETEKDRRGNTIKWTYDHQEPWEGCSDVQKQVPGLYPHCASPYAHFTFRVAQIDYTSRGDEGPRREVVFHHAPPDPSRTPAYLRVWDREKQSYDFMNVSGLLDSIEMYGPTEETWQGAPELAWSYKLAYQTSPDSGRPLLASIKKCSASGGCLLAREFRYSERSPGAEDTYEVLWERTLFPLMWSDQHGSEQPRLFDANLDGKDDLYIWEDMMSSRVYLAADPSSSVSTFWGPGPDSVPADLDGDGAAELIGTRLVSFDPFIREKWIYKPLPSGVLDPWAKLPDMPAMWQDDPYVKGYDIWHAEAYPILLGDLDGDQLPDLCRSRPGITLLPEDFPFHDIIEWTWTCALNLGDGSFGPFGHTKHTTFIGNGPTYLADLDGNGRVEFHQGEELIGDADGDGLSEVIATGTLDDTTLGDFDGDGRTDQLVDGTLEVSYAWGGAAVQDLSAHRPGDGNEPVGTYRGDFDGNGRDDILLVWNDADGVGHLKAITMAGPDPDRLIEVRDEDSEWRERITYSRELAPDGDPTDGSALSVPMVAIDPNGVTDTWVHDDLGRVLYALPQAGNVQTTAYERWIENGLVRGTIIQTSGADGSASEVWLDEEGRAVTVKSRGFAGQWMRASIERDSLGRVSFEERLHNTGATFSGTGTRYNSLDQIIEVTLPDGTSRKSKYDFFEAVHYDAQENEQHVVYDFDGRVVQTTRTAVPMPWDAGSIVTSSVVHGPFGQIKTVTDPGGNQSQMFYDGRGRRYLTLDPDRGPTTVQYNGHSEIESVQTATDTLIYTRDDAGRVTHVTSAEEGITELTWDTSVNGLGKLAAAKSWGGTLVEYTYEDAGRVKDVTWTIDGANAPLTVTRTYNGVGQLETVTYPKLDGLGLTKVKYAFNPHGYLHEVYDVSDAVGSALLWSVKARNGDGTLREARGGDWKTKLDYDEPSGRLKEIKVTRVPAQTDVFHMMYERDDNGFVKRRMEFVEGRDEVFHMDGHRRLKEWLLEYGQSGAGSGTQASIYSYDAIDNLEKVKVSGSVIASYEERFTHGKSGKPHALYNNATAADPQTYWYDAGGRMTGGDGKQITYASDDLPRTVTTPAGTTHMTYDASGARVKKQGPTGMTLSISGLFERREEVSGISQVFVVHTSDGPVAEIVYRASAPEPRVVHYRHHEMLGSVAVTTTQGGAVSRRYHEPYGGRVAFDGSPAAAPSHDVHHGFTGHAHDDELGLIDMRGRVYSPSTRQFLTPDPLGRLGASPYSYVSNNPLNWIDPSGFTEEDPQGRWYSGFLGVFSSAPVAAIDISPSLVSAMVAAVAAMEFPHGNDAPNSSGCPTGTGTAPVPCAAPGEAGCSPPLREPPTVRQAPPKTFGDDVVRTLTLDDPPRTIGLYSFAHHIKQGILKPTVRWLSNEPEYYLDSDHNVRRSVLRRDHSHEMAPVVGEVALMVAPGANALAQVGRSAARGGAVRGINRFGGVVSGAENAAGGTVVTAQGSVQGADFAGHVNAGLMRGGPVNILSGVHGSEAGVMTADAAILAEDVAMFGGIEGVTVHNTATLAPSAISSMLNGPGTTIGAFCNSGVCLAPFMGF